MKFTIFNDITGQIIQSGNCIDSDYDLQIVPEGCSKLPIYADVINQYIENGELKNIPPKPEYECYFDYGSKAWVQDSDAQQLNVKNKRKYLLLQSDWTQIPNNPLTPEKQQQWAVYRQQLRDITNQPGYPFNVAWPAQPE